MTPTQFLESINSINEILIEAHSVRYAFLDNFLGVVTLQMTSVLGVKTHYDRVRIIYFLSTFLVHLLFLLLPQEMDKLQTMFDDLNASLYNPAGLHLLWPRQVAFLFVSTLRNAYNVERD